MPAPPGDYEDFLFDIDDLVAQVKVLRQIVRDAARADQAASALLAWFLPQLGPLLSEVQAALAGAERGRQGADVLQPPDDDPAFSSRTGPLPARVRLLGNIVRFAAAGDELALASLPRFLPDLEELLGDVEGALRDRN